MIAGSVVYDAFGNELKDSDLLKVIRYLKINGSSLVVKVGTKVKNIRIVSGDHEINRKIDAVGTI